MSEDNGKRHGLTDVQWIGVAIGISVFGGLLCMLYFWLAPKIMGENQVLHDKWMEAAKDSQLTYKERQELRKIGRRSKVQGIELLT